ncbi:carboxylating nicotinate-nucleotide diphosphorylase [Desulfovibrio sp. OttesenSCG-928-G15]|nr:carboxylating nicotinate-nucleotide diphosphorylase [Desulfovibrio sp. OttesenSCG-928-G15]
MQWPIFDIFFTGPVREHLVRAIDEALEEDGPDLTSNAVFSPSSALRATITAKEGTLVAGLPIARLVLEATASLEAGEWTADCFVKDGDAVAPGTRVCEISGSARVILRAERVILNFLCHMSGIANLTARYVEALGNTGVKLLDTRKTLPGLRYPEKYAVLVGGGHNHRKNLGEILMLKDNHVDASGGITGAVARLRAAYAPCPPIEVECRTLDEVREAVYANVERIMLDNMPTDMMCEALGLIPDQQEVEISGGVSLDSIGRVAEDICRQSSRKPDFISVGRLTHSAPYADFSMRIWKDDTL